MYSELNRYFIELQPVETESVPRYRETEMRRAQASQFLETVSKWLLENELANKVSAMAITALGQVQITCEPDVIHQIRSHEDLNVATIRQSTILTENALRLSETRWNEAR